jgi:hypothetical protein
VNAGGFGVCGAARVEQPCAQHTASPSDVVRLRLRAALHYNLETGLRVWPRLIFTNLLWSNDGAFEALLF